MRFENPKRVDLIISLQSKWLAEIKLETAFCQVSGVNHITSSKKLLLNNPNLIKSD